MRMATLGMLGLLVTVIGMVGMALTTSPYDQDWLHVTEAGLTMLLLTGCFFVFSKFVAWIASGIPTRESDEEADDAR